MRNATGMALVKLMAVMGMADLHAQSLACRRAHFDVLVALPEYPTLLPQLLIAGESAGLQSQLQRRMVRWYQQANTNTA